jgi:hypothetical protein
MNRFRAREWITKEGLEDALETGDVTAITQAIMDAADCIDDAPWLLLKLAPLLTGQVSHWITGTTIIALTEMAVFERVDPREVRALVEPLRQREDVRDWVEDALEDLEHLGRLRAH